MNRNFVRKRDAGQRIIAIVNVVHQVVQSKGTDWVLPFELGQKGESTLMNVFCFGSADFLRCAKATLSSLQTLAPIMILLGRKVFSVRSMVPLLRVWICASFAKVEMSGTRDTTPLSLTLLAKR